MREYLDPAKLPPNLKRDIQAFIDESNLRGVEITHLTEYEALDYYLKQNGIINWTSAILDAVNAIKRAEIRRSSSSSAY